MREKIIQEIIADGTVDSCVKYQCRKLDGYLKEEITQEIWLWLLEYDEEKLIDAYENRHINALISAFIRHNVWSRNSPFYKKFLKYSDNCQEITNEQLNMPDE